MQGNLERDSVEACPFFTEPEMAQFGAAGERKSESLRSNLRLGFRRIDCPKVPFKTVHDRGEND